MQLGLVPGYPRIGFPRITLGFGRTSGFLEKSGTEPYVHVLNFFIYVRPHINTVPVYIYIVHI